MNAIAVSLTVLEIFLAVLALSGFYLLRSAAENAARQEARLVAQEEVERTVAPIARRAAVEYLKSFTSSRDPDDESLVSLIEALDDNSEDDQNA